MKPDTALRFGVLGPLRVERGTEVLELPGSKVLRGLLGTLLLAGSRPLTAERLADLLWSGRKLEVSKGTVHVGLCRLRTWMRQRRDSGWDDIRIAHGGDGYRIVIDERALDASRFHALARRAYGVSDEMERFRLLRAAMSHVRGATLEGLTALDLGDPLIHETEAAVCDAGLSFGAVAVRTGHAAEAVAGLEALARCHPLTEPIHACLIEVLAAAGRPAQAIGRFEALRSRLAVELGVVPSAPAQAAYQAVLAATHRWQT